jgi:hypothetical protein
VIVVAERGHEDDRHALGALALANELGGLEAVHAGHVDVEQDYGEVVVEQAAQRLTPGIGADDGLPKLLEHRLERQQLVRLVVDDEDVDLTDVHKHKMLNDEC